jgi:DNA-binding transcriptional regulator YhcF (GntR family)
VIPEQAETDPAPLSELERGDDLPIGVNLAWRLTTLIQSGRLAAGERLPGVREMADGAGVNVNTARAVYRRLEEQGLVVSVQGLGTYVAPNVMVSPRLEELAAEIAASARAEGIEPRELARALYAGSAPDAIAPGELDRGTEALDRPDVRASLRSQIARLEAELAAYPDHPQPEQTEPAAIGPRPRIAALNELEAIRDDLFGKLQAARAHASKRGARQSAARLRRELAQADPAAHRWEIGADADAGDPGCGTWQVRPAWGPVGALTNWWRVKMSSGCP